MSFTEHPIRVLALAAAFAAGAAFGSPSSRASTARQSPYAPLSQMARVLVLLENQYVDPVERQHLLEGAIKGMVAELDPHSAFLDRREFALFNEDTEGSFGGIGVEVDFEDDYVVVLAPIAGAPAARAGVRAGDLIVAVNGKLLSGMSIDKIVRLMRGAPKTRVRITVKRRGVADPIELTLTREHVHVPSVESKRLLGEVGYLRLKQFQQGTHQELLQQVAKLREAAPTEMGAVVLDMRNNPGGLVDEAEAVADELLDGGGIYTTRHRGRVVGEVRAHGGGALSRLPMVLLVNEYSASSAELVAGALQDNHRATVIGARTFGKGSVQTIFQLPEGAGLRLTTMRYYTPAGHAIQAAGIEPSIAIEYENEDGSHSSALRESALAGHLAPEEHARRGRGRKVLQGGKRPKYVPISKVPTDPKKSDDFALALAHTTALALIKRR